MRAIWAKGKSKEKNITLAFLLKLNKKMNFDIKLSASSYYKLFIDGNMVGFGPQRASHGYFRAQNFSGKGKVIVVEVSNVGVKNFCWIKQQPFFACEMLIEDGTTYTQSDFSCYILDDRIQKVQRYSYQRGFAENYIMERDRTSLYSGNSFFSQLEVEEVRIPIELKSYVENAKLKIHKVKKTVEVGVVNVDESLPVWRDRAHFNVGKELEGYNIDEWQNSSTDEASKFIYIPNGQSGDFQYITYDFGRATTGFSNLKIDCKNAGTVYFIFDELLWAEKGKGENYVGFERNTCSSVHKWTLTGSGTYNVSTSEPYTVRYATVVFSKGINIEASITDFENPNTERFKFRCEDNDINLIMESARNTLAQNSVDVLMDCPSRERSGWLSDSWFSSVAERVFTGENNAEKTFLENYITAKGDLLPENVLPMNYPADDYDGTFIPNWNFWYVLELYKYYKIYGRDEIIDKSIDNVKKILRYFLNKENEFSLLEDLDSWVFIEWSSANEKTHTTGVNIPSNITYAKVLDCASELLNDNALKVKSNAIRCYIKEHAFSGLFLVDNLVRNEKKELVKTENFTEVCQYYAFWFDLLDVANYKKLFDELINNFGPNRKRDYKKEIGQANVMYGLYMRIDLLMRIGDRKSVLKECKSFFLKMAKRTGTLWENNDISASCNHGFASYVCKWIIFALTGYDIVQEKFTSKEETGIKCEIEIPNVLTNKKMHLKV